MLILNLGMILISSLLFGLGLVLGLDIGLCLVLGLPLNIDLDVLLIGSEATNTCKHVCLLVEIYENDKKNKY